MRNNTGPRLRHSITGHQTSLTSDDVRQKGHSWTRNKGSHLFFPVGLHFYFFPLVDWEKRTVSDARTQAVDFIPQPDLGWLPCAVPERVVVFRRESRCLGVAIAVALLRLYLTLSLLHATRGKELYHSNTQRH